MNGGGVLRGLSFITLFIFAILGIIIGAICFSSYNAHVDWYNQWCSGDMAVMQLLNEGLYQECRSSKSSQFIYQIGYILSFGFSIVSVLISMPILVSGRKNVEPPVSGMKFTGWGTKCPNCKAMNILNSSELPSNIACGNCNAIFTPKSIENIARNS
jgi:hypothetical protein